MIYHVSDQTTLEILIDKGVNLFREDDLRRNRDCPFIRALRERRFGIAHFLLKVMKIQDFLSL